MPTIIDLVVLTRFRKKYVNYHDGIFSNILLNISTIVTRCPIWPNFGNRNLTVALSGCVRNALRSKCMCCGDSFCFCDFRPASSFLSFSSFSPSRRSKCPENSQPLPSGAPTKCGGHGLQGDADASIDAFDPCVSDAFDACPKGCCCWSSATAV